MQGGGGGGGEEDDEVVETEAEPLQVCQIRILNLKIQILNVKYQMCRGTNEF